MDVVISIPPEIDLELDDGQRVLARASGWKMAADAIGMMPGDDGAAAPASGMMLVSDVGRRLLWLYPAGMEPHAPSEQERVTRFMNDWGETLRVLAGG